LNSFKGVGYPNYRIYLVDNGSTDGSTEKLVSEFKNDEIRILLNGENLGFSRGCNRGIIEALKDDCDYVLLLNNDCIVRDVAFLERGVEFAEAHPDCGIEGGKILFWPEAERIWSTGGYIKLFGAEKHIAHGEMDKGQYETVCERKFISGAFMFIKRKVLEKLGPLPEEYFFGKEEWEYSIRAIKAGFKLYYNPAFTIYHEASHSHCWTDPMYIYISTLSKILYKKRNHSWSFFLLWVSLYRLYVNVLFPIKYHSRKNIYVKGVEPKAIRLAMRRALIDSENISTISRSMGENFRREYFPSFVK
jgi:GT2 family glycosyltransferase